MNTLASPLLCKYLEHQELDGQKGSSILQEGLGCGLRLLAQNNRQQTDCDIPELRLNRLADEDGDGGRNAPALKEFVHRHRHCLNPLLKAAQPGGRSSILQVARRDLLHCCTKSEDTREPPGYIVAAVRLTPCLLSIVSFPFKAV